MGCIRTILPSLSLTKSWGPALGTWNLLSALAQFLASTTAILVDGDILGFGLGSKDELKLVVVLLEDEAPTSGGTKTAHNYNCWLTNDLSFKLHTIRHSSVLTDGNYGKLRALVLNWIIFRSCNCPTDVRLYRNDM